MSNAYVFARALVHLLTYADMLQTLANDRGLTENMLQNDTLLTIQHIVKQ